MILYYKDGVAVQVENGVRRLWIGDMCQGQADNNKPWVAVSPYAKELLGMVNKPKTALVIGLGAGLIPQALNKRGVKVTVIEPREDIIAIAKRFFKLSKDITIVQGLAQDVLPVLGYFDLIVNDAHDGKEQPPELMTPEFYEKLRNHLNPEGQILANVIEDQKNVIKALA